MSERNWDRLLEIASAHTRGADGLTDAEREAKTAQNVQNRGEFKRGLLSGIDESQGMLYGAAGMVGSIASDAGLPGGEGLRDWGLRGYQRNQLEAQQNPRSVTDVREAIQSPGQFADWAAGTAGSLTPFMAEIAATSLIGAAVGTATAGPVGTVGGGVAGAFGRIAAKKAITELVERQVAKGVAREVAERQAKRFVVQQAAKQAVTKGLTGGADEVFLRQGMRELGAKVGVMAGEGVIEAGGMYGEGVAEGYDNPYSALALGAVSGSLNLFGGNSRLVGEVLGSGAKRAFTRNLRRGNLRTAGEILLQVARQGGEEALQEMGQESLGMANTWVNDPDFNWMDGENAWQLINAGAAGALGGVGGGAVSAANNSWKSDIDLEAATRRTLKPGGEGGWVSELDKAKAVASINLLDATMMQKKQRDLQSTQDEQMSQYWQEIMTSTLSPIGGKAKSEPVGGRLPGVPMEVPSDEAAKVRPLGSRATETAVTEEAEIAPVVPSPHPYMTAPIDIVRAHADRGVLGAQTALVKRSDETLMQVDRETQAQQDQLRAGVEQEMQRRQVFDGFMQQAGRSLGQSGLLADPTFVERHQARMEKVQQAMADDDLDTAQRLVSEVVADADRQLRRNGLPAPAETEAEVGGMPVGEIRKRLRDMGLDATGSKRKLARRLAGAVAMMRMAAGQGVGSEQISDFSGEQQAPTLAEGARLESRPESQPESAGPAITVEQIDSAPTGRSRDNLLLAKGQYHAPGLRLGDQREAGALAYMVERGEATVQEWSDWIDGARRENRFSDRDAPVEDPVAPVSRPTSKPEAVSRTAAPVIRKTGGKRAGGSVAGQKAAASMGGRIAMLRLLNEKTGAYPGESFDGIDPAQVDAVRDYMISLQQEPEGPSVDQVGDQVDSGQGSGTGVQEGYLRTFDEITAETQRLDRIITDPNTSDADFQAAGKRSRELRARLDAEFPEEMASLKEAAEEAAGRARGLSASERATGSGRTDTDVAPDVAEEIERLEKKRRSIDTPSGDAARAEAKIRELRNRSLLGENRRDDTELTFAEEQEALNKAYLDQLPELPGDSKTREYGSWKLVKADKGNGWRVNLASVSKAIVTANGLENARQMVQRLYDAGLETVNENLQAPGRSPAETQRMLRDVRDEFGRQVAPPRFLDSVDQDAALATARAEKQDPATTLISKLEGDLGGKLPSPRWDSAPLRGQSVRPQPIEKTIKAKSTLFQKIKELTRLVATKDAGREPLHGVSKVAAENRIYATDGKKMVWFNHPVSKDEVLHVASDKKSTTVYADAVGVNFKAIIPTKGTMTKVAEVKLQDLYNLLAGAMRARQHLANPSADTLAMSFPVPAQGENAGTKHEHGKYSTPQLASIVEALLSVGVKDVAIYVSGKDGSATPLYLDGDKGGALLMPFGSPHSTVPANWDGTIRESNGDRSARFKRDARAREGQTAEGLTKALGTVSRGVRIVDGFEALPAEVKARAQMMFGEAMGVQGAFYNGEVWLVADQIADVAEAGRVLAHELIAHKGMREVFGAEFGQVLDEIGRSLGSEKLAGVAKRYGLDLNTLEGRREAVDEYIAEVAETGGKPSWWRRLVRAVKAGLRRIGLQVDYSKADIEAILGMVRQRREAATEQRATAGSGEFGSLGSDTVLYSDIPSYKQDMDKPYLAAVERGDMEAAQRMVDEAARRAGYNVGPVYHGTSSKFNTFSVVAGPRSKMVNDIPAIHFNTQLQNAQRAAEFVASMEGGAPRVISAYLKVDNPYSFWDGEASRTSDNDARHTKSQGTKNEEWAVFDPNQIKSADPVTYDDAGGVIPLSERFNERSDDIRFKKKAPFKKTESGERPRTTPSEAALAEGRKMTDGEYVAAAEQMTPVWEKALSRLKELNITAALDKYAVPVSQRLLRISEKIKTKMETWRFEMERDSTQDLVPVEGLFNAVIATTDKLSLRILKLAMAQADTSKIQQMMSELDAQQRAKAQAMIDAGVTSNRQTKKLAKILGINTEEGVKDLKQALRDPNRMADLLNESAISARYAAARKVLDGLIDRLKDVGVEVNRIEEYWPRKVRDVKGLISYLRQESPDDWSLIDRAIREREQARGGHALTEEEVAHLVNNMLRNMSTGSTLNLQKTSNQKERRLDVVPPEAFDKYYLDPFVATVRYIQEANKQLAWRKLLGKTTTHVDHLRQAMTGLNDAIGRYDAQIKTETDPQVVAALQQRMAQAEGRRHAIRKVLNDMAEEEGISPFYNLENSIGMFVWEMRQNGEIGANQEEELKKILIALYQDRGPGAKVQMLRELAYIDSMGQISSAITQIGDIGFAMDAGVGNVLASGWDIILRRLGMRELAEDTLTRDMVTRDIADEFRSDSIMGKVLDRVFFATGLHAMDKFGKEVVMNANLRKTKQLIAKAKAGDAKAEAQIRRRLGEFFGDSWEQAMGELMANNPEALRRYGWGELSRVQPISQLEMTEGYLTGGNMRVLYMLKTFQVKQISAIWSTNIGRAKRAFEAGNKEEGMYYVKQALTMAVFFMLMGATANALKDLLYGREIDPNEMVVDTLMSLIGVSRWDMYNARRNGIATAAYQRVIPPHRAIDRLYRAFLGENPDPLRAVEVMPVVGKLYYEHMREKAPKKKRGGGGYSGYSGY